MTYTSHTEHAICGRKNEHKSETLKQTELQPSQWTSSMCNRRKALTIRKQDINRITAGEVKFIWRTTGYTKWDPK